MNFRKYIGVLGICMALLLTGCGSQSQITQVSDKYKNMVEETTEVPDSDANAAQNDALTSSQAPDNSGNGASMAPADGDKSAKASSQPTSQESENPTAQASSDSKTKSVKKASSATDKASTSKKTKSKTSSAKKTKSKTSSTTNKNQNKTTANNASESSDSNKTTSATQSSESSKDKETQAPVATAKPADKKCTISIDCKTILSNMKSLNSAKTSFVPANGIILSKTTVTVKADDTVYDILARVCNSKKIHLESDYTPAYKTYYVKGIHQLYEMDCGDLSGWTYLVNGVKPNYGASKYTVKDGDNIEWRFTCNAGKDVG